MEFIFCCSKLGGDITLFIRREIVVQDEVGKSTNIQQISTNINKVNTKDRSGFCSFHKPQNLFANCSNINIYEILYI